MASYEKITSDAVKGMILVALEEASVSPWIQALTGDPLPSNSASEEYADLGMTPGLREWIGGRQAKELNEKSFEVKNRAFESTLIIPTDYLRRDKLALLERRIADLGTRAETHWNGLVSDLIVNGETDVCYDGQAFFSASHSFGSSGTQSNDITVTVSTAPVDVKGTHTNPSQQTMHWAIYQAIQQIHSFVDDQGELINEDAEEFLVVVPNAYAAQAVAAVHNTRFEGDAENTLMHAGYRISVRSNARLDLASMTTKIAVFRINSPGSALLRQEEFGAHISSKAEGSDYEFDEKAHQYGVDVSRNAFYGEPLAACMAELVA